MTARRPLPRWKRGVREAIYDHVYSSPAGEVGGVLVGDIPSDGPVRISGAIAALSAEGERASVTFTHDAWAEVHAALERDHKGKRIVGWYHSHPGFGIFLSEHDLFIQRNFFGDPAQVAYVVDPHASTEGLFGWVDGEITQVASAKTPRTPVRISVPREVAPVLVARRGRPLWATALWCFLGGLIAGGVIWFAALRPTDSPSSTAPAPATSTPTTSTETQTTPTTNTAGAEVAPDNPAAAATSPSAPAAPPAESNTGSGGSGKPNLGPPPSRAPAQPPSPSAANGAQMPPPGAGSR